MTLYARGYRRYEDGFAATSLRFRPIFAEGFGDAIRTKAFRRFVSLFVLLTIVFCMLFYVNPVEVARRVAPGGAVAGAPSTAELLRDTVANFLGTLDWLSPLLVIFVGSGLVAEDLRTRALPLYLVRTITPFDYWLGKFLIPAGVLAVAVLLPAFGLVLFGVLLQPSDEVISFAAGQGRLVLGILGAYAASSVAYGSLVLLFSTITARRTPALVFGAATIFLSPVVVGLAWNIKTHGGRVPEAAHGGVFELIKALMLPGDVTSIFASISGARLEAGEGWGHAPVWAAASVIGSLFVVSAALVIRRARTVEVVS